jgi:ABC-type transporter MlaC component
VNDHNPFSDGRPAVQLQKPGFEEKLHHHLISGEIFVLEGDSVASIKLNTVLLTPENRITAMDIGKAQKALQMHFFKRRNIEDSSDIKIVDVYIAGISYLGLMKPTFFAKMDVPSTGG